MPIVRFCYSSIQKRYKSIRASEPFCYLAQRHSASPKPNSFLCLFLGESSRATVSDFEFMGMIFFTRDPFKIFNAVVLAVTVYMVNLLSRLWLANKSGGHCSMGVPRLAVNRAVRELEVHSKGEVSVGVPSERKLPSSSAAPYCSANLTQVAGLIEAHAFRYSLPSLHAPILSRVLKLEAI